MTFNDKENTTTTALTNITNDNDGSSNNMTHIAVCYYCTYHSKLQHLFSNQCQQNPNTPHHTTMIFWYIILYEWPGMRTLAYSEMFEHIPYFPVSNEDAEAKLNAWLASRSKSNQVRNTWRTHSMYAMLCFPQWICTVDHLVKHLGSSKYWRNGIPYVQWDPNFLPHAKEFWMGTELLVPLEEKSPSTQEIIEILTPNLIARRCQDNTMFWSQQLHKHACDACAKIVKTCKHMFIQKLWWLGEALATPNDPSLDLGCTGLSCRKHQKAYALYFMFWRFYFHHRNSLSCFCFKRDLGKLWNLPNRYILLKNISLKLYI